MSFTNIFGGGTLQSSDSSFRSVALSGLKTLVWPLYSVTPDDSFAGVMEVTASAVNSILRVPEGDQVSPGQSTLITNRGALTFTVSDSVGGVLATLVPGAAKFFYLTDNSTVQGTWSVLLFGVTASALDAASLAGLGVTALGSTLSRSEPVLKFTSSGAFSASDRAKVYVWTGGVGTGILPLSTAPGVGSDFSFEVRNGGTGTLTLPTVGGELIDGASTIALQPAESARVHSDGAGNWYTVGRGRSTQFAFTVLNKVVTGGAVVLTSTEAANIVQKYTGALTSNCIVTFPPVVQVYYVNNQTTGAFSLTFKCGAGGTVTVPANQNAVLFCDGINTSNASTTVAGLASLTLAQGSVSTPSINYSGDATTGIFSPASGQVDVVSAGVSVAHFTSAGLSLTGALTVSGGGAFGAVVSGITPTAAGHLATKGYVDAVAGSGSGFLPVSAGAGAPVTGVLYLNASEALRAVSNGAFISFYNASNTVRTGYIQYSAGLGVTFAAENAAGVFNWVMGGVVAATLTGAGGGQLTLPLLHTTTGITSDGAITGNLTGNVTGNVTGSLTGNVTGNVSGSAGSAGSVPWTGVSGRPTNVSQFINDAGYVTSVGAAAAGSLTGATLAAGVVNSSLTNVGTLTSLTVTTPIVGSVTGSSSSATTAGSASSVTGVSSNGYGTRTVSTSAPGGGSDGDVWYQV